MFVRVAALGEAGQLAVSVKTAARITDFSTTFVWAAVNKQHLPAYRVGGTAVRILIDDLQSWLTRVRHNSEDDI